jgi:hypothetical protein
MGFSRDRTISAERDDHFGAASPPIAGVCQTYVYNDRTESQAIVPRKKVRTGAIILFRIGGILPPRAGMRRQDATDTI